MPSIAETLAAAVATALGAVPGATLRRGGVLPEDITAAGLINVVETEPVEMGELLGGEREMALELDIELGVAVADDAARAAALDTLAQACAAALAADAALAAATDHLRLHPLRDREDLPVPGAAAIRTATLPVELHFRTAANPLE